jgi:hypothetical protein
MEEICSNINIERTKSFVNVENTITTKPTKSKAPRAPRQPKTETVMVEISYDNFKNNSIDFIKYKLPELKDALKKYNLRISGKKELLIKRLETYFKKHSNAIIIQRFFRGWIVRYFIRLKGPAFKDVSLCTNDSDFVTMEPLNEMKKDVFYSYKDSKNFIYGFDITSLIQMLQKKNKIENPYNREKIDQTRTKEIKTVYNLSFLIYPHFKDENERIPQINNYINQHRSRTYTPNNPMNNAQHQNTIRSNNNNANIRTTNNANNANIAMTPEMIIRHTRLSEIREKPINERINHLFTEIDSLGNYTSSTWFSNLDIRNYVRLYRILYDIWFFRSNLSREVRNFICPNTNPFDGILPRILHTNNLTFTQIQNACLTTIESMVYTGINDDYRRIGTFHALSALTLVSIDARTSLPWLYESVAFS